MFETVSKIFLITLIGEFLSCSLLIALLTSSTTLTTDKILEVISPSKNPSDKSYLISFIFPIKSPLNKFTTPSIWSNVNFNVKGANFFSYSTSGLTYR